MSSISTSDMSSIEKEKDTVYGENFASPNFREFREFVLIAKISFAKSQSVYSLHMCVQVIRENIFREMLKLANSRKFSDAKISPYTVVAICKGYVCSWLPRLQKNNYHDRYAVAVLQDDCQRLLVHKHLLRLLLKMAEMPKEDLMHGSGAWAEKSEVETWSICIAISITSTLAWLVNKYYNKCKQIYSLIQNFRC